MDLNHKFIQIKTNSYVIAISFFHKIITILECPGPLHLI
jgi:hypothetical protein